VITLIRSHLKKSNVLSLGFVEDSCGQATKPSANNKLKPKYRCTPEQKHIKEKDERLDRPNE
jgi:hypothetical protein